MVTLITALHLIQMYYILLVDGEVLNIEPFSFSENVFGVIICGISQYLSRQYMIKAHIIRIRIAGRTPRNWSKIQAFLSVWSLQLFEEKFQQEQLITRKCPNAVRLETWCSPDGGSSLGDYFFHAGSECGLGSLWDTSQNAFWGPFGPPCGLTLKRPYCSS